MRYDQVIRVCIKSSATAQAAEQIKAEPYERTEEREDYRNGYYKRRLETRLGI